LNIGIRSMTLFQTNSTSTPIRSTIPSFLIMSKAFLSTTATLCRAESQTSQSETTSLVGTTFSKARFRQANRKWSLTILSACSPWCQPRKESTQKTLKSTIRRLANAERRLSFLRIRTCFRRASASGRGSRSSIGTEKARWRQGYPLKTNLRKYRWSDETYTWANSTIR